jgi:NAD(P)-dependent dehydrogenase (short-subunit alcohol dehydrogenase family)
VSGANDQFLRGRHAIITGGGKGIGAAIATSFAKVGATLSLLGRDSEAIATHGKGLEKTFKIQVQSITCDVSEGASVEQAFATAQKAFGTPYILVNNAGQAEAASFTDMRREIWDRMIAVNLTGTYLCSQQVIGPMLQACEGRIVNIASSSGVKGYTKMTAYCAAKHGVVGLTRALALETARKGITVNAVCPGYTETEMGSRAIENVRRLLGKTEDEARQILLRSNPQGVFIKPEEVAAAVLWLCSPEAASVTGSAIPVAGGEIM